ncbi:MAG: hypothetical protein IJT91_05375 [Clostridia bacterium]|nr:hypothetical protein [Clostridia bacterium]
MADIILKNLSGTPVTYSGVDTVRIPRSGGGYADFTEGSDIELPALMRYSKANYQTVNGTASTWAPFEIDGNTVTLTLTLPYAYDISVNMIAIPYYLKLGGTIQSYYNAEPTVTVSGSTVTITATKTTSSGSFSYGWGSSPSAPLLLDIQYFLPAEKCSMKPSAEYGGYEYILKTSDYVPSKNGAFGSPSITSVVFRCQTAKNICMINYGSYTLKKVVYGAEVTSVESLSFSQQKGLEKIHFLPSSPPTVAQMYTFSGLPTGCKIYVPAGSLSAYTSASNYPDPNTYTYEEE